MVDAGKLGLGAQLAFWRQHGRFPNDEADIAPAVIAHLAAQTGVGGDEELDAWFAYNCVTQPGAYRLGRILRSAQVAQDDAALQRVAERLDAGMRERLGALLADDGDGTAYARLAADPGRVDLESLLAEIAKVERLRALALPPDLLRGLHPDQAKRFRRRAAVESAWELQPASRAHPSALVGLLVRAARGRGVWIPPARSRRRTRGRSRRRSPASGSSRRAAPCGGPAAWSALPPRPAPPACGAGTRRCRPRR